MNFRAGRWLLVAVLVSAAGLAETAWAQTDQKRVLVLYSTRRDAQIAVVGDRELPRLLEQGLPTGLDYYSEFIDRSRFSQTDYHAAFRDFLQSKYHAERFDLVIAMDDIPIEFIDTYRDALFADTPVVFFSSRALPRRLANSTGLIAELDLASTLALATELQPDTRQVFVVTGASDAGRSYERAARVQLRTFESRVAITYLAGLPTKELEARLASLPQNAIVYYLLVERDGDNQNFHPLEYLSRVTAVANAPVYCWVDSAMDRGVVGGSLKDQVAQTRAVAALALRVLNGEPADRIPITSPDLNVRQLDWRQLRRWGISEARVPVGTVIRFREPSAWDRYKVYILAAATVLLAQTVLIAGLLVLRARRRQAEERIRDLGVRLLNAQETERARVARELHDDVSQQMALLEMDLEQLGGAVEGKAEGLAGEALHRARGIARSVHELSHRLHPAKLRLIGLVSALNGLQRELSQSGVRIRFTHEDVPKTLSSNLTLHLFRIVQEALQNAIKYSRAQLVDVHLRGLSNRIELTVVDDGVGFDVDAAWGKGLGLISMDERVEALGGVFEIRSKPGAGTELKVTVPLPEPAATASLDGSHVAAPEPEGGNRPIPYRADSA